MELDTATVTRWLEPLARRPEEIAEVFTESRREVATDWRDGELREARVSIAEGLSARWRRGAEQRLAFVSRRDEEGARDAIRAVQKGVGLSPLPVRPAKAREAAVEELRLDTDRWVKRLSALFARHVSRHRFRWTLRDIERRVISARVGASAASRRLLSTSGGPSPSTRRSPTRRPMRCAWR